MEQNYCRHEVKKQLFFISLNIDITKFISIIFLYIIYTI